MIGRPFGRFRITGKLGQGGMATVWKAEDGLLGRPVALKLLSETLMGSPDARRRFLHEAETARLLDHPGIAAVHDAGETDGVAWLAMEYVEGETLSERITQRLMPLEEAVRIVCEAAAALSHAHARGVVHRDVTPRNIMVTRDGRTKVLDFGLALVEGQSRVTTSQTRLGTVSYLSPEVAIGHTADPRTDLYGLGVVLYEALTGALPFASDRPEAVLYGIVNQPPTPPRTYRPEIPETLERVVLHAMARRPEDRHGSADELAAELRAVAPAADVPPHEQLQLWAWVGEDEPLPPPHTRGGPVYLAVLPFEDAVTSDDPQGGRRALAAGLAETVAAALGRGLDLHVIPPAPTAPPAGETSRLDLRAYRSACETLDELDGWSGLGDEPRREDIAAALGPIGLLCIRRTLVEGAAVGAVSGLGAATADSLYASVAAFGLTALSDVLVGARRPLGVVGGCFLLALAVHSLTLPAMSWAPTGLWPEGRLPTGSTLPGFSRPSGSNARRSRRIVARSPGA